MTSLVPRDGGNLRTTAKRLQHDGRDREYRRTTTAENATAKRPTDRALASLL